MQTPSYPRELTLIPRPPEQVIGRAKQLKTIHENLDNYKAPIVLVNGIGGIGKTTVALEFIQQHGAAYPHLAWIEVTDIIPAAMVANKTLLKNLHLEAELETLPPDTYEAQAFDLIINKLNQLPACLLVIDNANNLDDLLRCEQRLRSLNAKTLLTSRAQPEEWKVVRIDELSPRDAYLLFTTHFETLVEEAQLEVVYALLKCLDYHTLLIELLAKAANKARLSLETLYEKVQQNYLHDADLNARVLSTGAHADHTKLPKQARIEHYITLVFQQISTLSDPEQRYLRYMTLLPSNEYAESFLEEVFQVATEIKPEFLDALESLAQKGWITRKRDERGWNYKVHNLVQEVAVRELGVSYEQCAPVVEYFIKSFDIDRYVGNLYDKVYLLPFGKVLKQFLQNVNHERIILLLKIINGISDIFNILQKEIEVEINEIKEAIKELGEVHPDVIKKQAFLALKYFGSGEFEEARKLLERFLTKIIKIFGESDFITMLLIQKLAECYEKIDLLDKAVNLHKQNLEIALKTWNENHSQVASKKSNLGLSYLTLGNYSEAQLLLEQALISNINNFGELDTEIATNSNNLAWAHRKQENWTQAKFFFQKAYNIWSKEFGEDHFYTQRTKENLAYIQAQLGESSEL